ncbi:amidophosphoribosyltransferase [Anaerobiospirillum thomasii]|uniref:Amidophosphoribosyltransferase n=1 Tax=Anaerobiospirillum thomasii TaxID=179995 RepID=A0A2X0V2H9_9GAMM|nr:amidophosphoribosyltransferase [Anaerobiospirillum thomasii]SPT68734.1 Amidophosphoribosyltransferase [Anaerobiospirillum thomasii]
MCGIVGMVATSPVNLSLYDALRVLQHRGQDAAGIITIDGGNFRQRKANGLVADVFEQKHMARLKGNIGIGHVRYPTAGSSSAAEAQPFYVNSPYGIALAHNGNLTNARELKKKCDSVHRHVNTSSDSEMLLNILAWKLSDIKSAVPSPEEIFTAIKGVNAEIRGAYAVVALIIGVGLIAFRDPNGIRPLVLGKRVDDNGKDEYMVASESVALDVDNFKLVRDIAPGEAVFISNDGKLYSDICASETKLCSCIFEYVYFARPDSILDGVSVYASRVRMGTKLANKIMREYAHLDIDVVIPIPETSSDIAVQIARILGKPYRQGFVKNRYIGRTFIMPGQKQRKKSVRNKLNPIPAEFKDKRVLLVDDSIVRGTTSEQIVDMARDAGAKAIYFASAAPEIRYPNVYGIDMPTRQELIAYGRNNDEICKQIHADALIFQSLEDLCDAVREENPALKEFETSVFNGTYITGDVDEEYFKYLEEQRSDDAKADKAWQDSANLELYNV